MKTTLFTLFTLITSSYASAGQFSCEANHAKGSAIVEVCANWEMGKSAYEVQLILKNSNIIHLREIDPTNRSMEHVSRFNHDQGVYALTMKSVDSDSTPVTIYYMNGMNYTNLETNLSGSLGKGLEFRAQVE